MTQTVPNVQTHRHFTLADLLGTYPQLTLREKLHMTIRWRVCPLPRIARLVPSQGTILDLGCGHGLFPLLLARESADRRVIGVDLDREKIALAERLTASVPNLSFQAEDIAAVADQLPPLDAVTILDVFYLVPFEIQARLLAICASRLAPGGVIVLKDMAEGPRWKAALNWLEETLAVRVLKITETSDPSARFYFRPRAEWIALLEGLGLRVTVQPLDRGYYHPHIAFIATKV